MRRLAASSLALLTLVNFAAPPLCAQGADAAPRESQAATRETPAAPTQGNAALEAMLEARLAPEVVAAKIDACACPFDTGPDALHRLKSRGATDEVLLAVIRSAVAHGRQGAPTSRQQQQPQAQQARRQSSAPSRVVVPAGTPVEVEAAHPINSAEVRAGDLLRFRVVRPVEVGGVIVIERGAVATARVVEARKGRPFGKAGKLAFAVSDAEGVDGKRIPLGFAGRLRGDSKGGTVATAMIITSVFVFPVAPLWGFKRGKSAVIPPGKIFAAAVQTDTIVEVAPER